MGKSGTPGNSRLISPLAVDAGLLDREVEGIPVSQLLAPISAKGPCRAQPGDIAEMGWRS